MNIIQTRNYDDMSEAAFEVVAQTIHENKHASINTTTGASYDGMFALLVEAINQGKLPLDQTIFTNLDEYISARNTAYSVYTYMHKNFYDLIDVKPKYIGLLDGSLEDTDAEMERYKAVLQTYPRDLQIVGLGTNAHLAANEPGESFQSRLFLADSDESTIQSTMGYHHLTREEAPTQMLTMGPAHIMAGTHILLASSAASNAEAVQAH